MNETLFKISRAFYLKYPKIKDYLAGKSATPSHEFETPANRIIENLSFSHIREIMTVEDSFARFFYETECIKCCWSVKELRRQIATNLFFRAGISQDPKKLLQQTVSETPLSYGIKEPFTFEFLNLPARPFNESDLEGAIMDHLQEFLLEMGKGFCFESRQKRIVIDNERRRQSSRGNPPLHKEGQENGGVCPGWNGQQAVRVHLHADLTSKGYVGKIPEGRIRMN